MRSPEIRTYIPDECAVFRKTTEQFGGLSNMASGYPLSVNGVRIFTSEALYQSCRFTHRPDIQRLILGERSPMTAKMRSKPHRKETRSDWEIIKPKVMRWCLRVKLAQNWVRFGELLKSTDRMQIVEESRRDDYWGAKRQPDGTLVGCNVLGRLLMELREALVRDPERLIVVHPPAIDRFFLLEKPIPVIRRDLKHGGGSQAQPTQRTFGDVIDQS